MKLLTSNIKFITKNIKPNMSVFSKFMKSYNEDVHILSNSIHKNVSKNNILDLIYSKKNVYGFIVKNLPEPDLKVDTNYIVYKERHMPHQKYGNVFNVLDIKAFDSINFFIPHSVNNVHVDTTKLTIHNTLYSSNFFDLYQGRETSDFLIFESDSINQGQQYKILSQIAQFFPLCMIVNTGKRSLHGWFYVKHLPFNEKYKLICMMQELFFDCIIPGSVVRFPLSTRWVYKNQWLQVNTHIVYFNPDFSSFFED